MTAAGVADLAAFRAGAAEASPMLLPKGGRAGAAWSRPAAPPTPLDGLIGIETGYEDVARAKREIAAAIHQMRMTDLPGDAACADLLDRAVRRLTAAEAHLHRGLATAWSVWSGPRQGAPA